MDYFLMPETDSFLIEKLEFRHKMSTWDNNKVVHKLQKNFVSIKYFVIKNSDVLVLKKIIKLRENNKN